MGHRDVPPSAAMERPLQNRYSRVRFPSAPLSGATTYEVIDAGESELASATSRRWARRNSIEARCSASGVRTRDGEEGSSALAGTGRELEQRQPLPVTHSDQVISVP